MPAPDDTALKALINSNIPDATAGVPRKATAAFVRATLFSLIDWVKAGINGNLSTWYKVGTANAPATNAENIYRTGKTILGRSADDGTPTNVQIQGGLSLNGIKFNENETFGLTTDIGGDTSIVDFNTLTKSGSYVILGSVWKADNHGPNIQFPTAWYYGVLTVIRREANDLIVQMYHTTDGEVFYRTKYFGNWGDWFSQSRNAPKAIRIGSNLAPTETLQVDGNALLNGIVKLTNITGNRKISMYGDNDHQFFGFGVNASVTRYQVGDTGGSHIFYAGTSPVTSAELMRIQGDGKIGIGIIFGETTTYPIDVHLQNPAIGVFMNLYNRSTSTQNGALMQFGQKDITTWTIGCLGTESTFVISGWSGSGMSEWLRILGASGFTGIGTTAPTSKMHLKGATGHQQLRLETAYTPTSTSDANGQTGQITWDQNYIYVKVVGGWRRAALNSW